MSLFSQFFHKLARSRSKRLRDPLQFQKALEAAYSAYLSGSMKTDVEAGYFLASWVGALGTPEDTVRLVVDILMKDVKADPTELQYRQRCRFCARLVASVRCDVELVHEHPAYAVAIYSLNCLHPFLFKEVLIRLLLGSNGRTVTNKADLFVQLAVAFDFLEHPKRAEALLRLVQATAHTNAIRPITADFALRLLGVLCALQGKIAAVIILNAEAEHLAETVHGLSSIQVDIAWALALCRTAMGSSRPPLVVVSVFAMDHIAKRRLPSEDLTDVDMLMHGLDRGRYPYLSTLSSMLALRITREAPPSDLDDESLAMTFVNTGNAVLRSEEMATEWNLVARQYFAELIQKVESGEIRTSPDVQYQVAQAHAGIGYSYSNYARTAEQDQREALYEKAKEHLDCAIGLLQQLGQDRWIEARVWAVAGSIEAIFGRLKNMHQRFAAGLLAGARYHHIDVEDLINFFTPDEDTRLKYSEALASAGDTNTAIVLAKAAVCSIHHHAVATEEIADLAPAYIGTRTLAHRTLINELSEAGRHNEGELAYDLLKENEYNQFTRRASSAADVARHVALTPFELEAIRQLKLGAIVLEAKVIKARNVTVDRLAEAFSKMDAKIKDLIASRRDTVIPESLRDSYEPSTNLESRDAVLRFISSGSTLSISLSTLRERKQCVVSIDERALGSLIFQFRQHCRVFSTDLQPLQSLGQQLHKVLFGQIQESISNEITHLYIEADKLVSSIPFAALYDGHQYLIQRFSLAHLNRVGLNAEVKESTTEAEHAAIFACTDTPGDELPGAAQEAKIISVQLSPLFPLALHCYVDRECTVEGFLKEILRPRGGHGLIHLATHAMFDPTSDAYSSLTFADTELSIRDLRTVLEESNCDTGLFVLSACGTARHDIDVEGFSSVLLRSGVKSVLSTLWETFDDSAPTFFRSFYSEINNFSSASVTASAARVAQLQLLAPNHDGNAAFAHPAHWAPYIVATARVS